MIHGLCCSERWTYLSAVIVCIVWLEGEDRKALEGEVSRVLCLAGLRGRKTTVEYTVSMIILV